MSGFGGLQRIRTRKHIRTIRSIPTSTDPSWSVDRGQETACLGEEEARLKVRRTEHERRRSIQWLQHGR